MAKYTVNCQIFALNLKKFTPAKKIYTNIFVAFVTNIRYACDKVSKYTANNFCKRMTAKFLEIDLSSENQEILNDLQGGGFNQQKKHFWLGLIVRRRDG